MSDATSGLDYPQFIPHIITPVSVSFFVDGRMRIIPNDHTYYDKIVENLSNYGKASTDEYRRSTLAAIRDYADIPTFVARVTEGRIQVGDAGVMFDGAPVHGVICDRLIRIVREGHDAKSLCRFLERMLLNPTATARDELYLWLESGNMPITSDGCFLAFKKVAHDYSSLHLNPDGTKLYNHVGSTPSMPREQVDPDRSETCSSGLHFCSWPYLPHFGLGGESRVVVLKVAPEDVVAIPHDYDNTKGRAWRYVVIAEVPEDECAELFAKSPTVSSFGLFDDTGDGDEEVFEEDDYSSSELDCTSGDCCDEHEGETQTRIFCHGNKVYTGEEISTLVSDYGQRGVSRLTGVPRTTLQGWLSQIS